ncbi:unnamed protein product [Schistosoma mattheei]|uniref:Uncharacterized protein n=1 Tax=Schistosoma mattheei TaxID=31246 RepID=A0A183NUR1_9TREM|nr:unnamed protein product [Schistosoma mattheei]
MESRTRVSFYYGPVSWMYLHLRVDFHSVTRTLYCSLQISTFYPLSYRDQITTGLYKGMEFNSSRMACLRLTVMNSSSGVNISSRMRVHSADESQIK